MAPGLTDTQPRGATATPGVALVTGAGRGIGRAIALRLAQDGYRLAVGYHTRPAGAEATVSEIRAQGGEAIKLAGDVTDPAAAHAIVTAAASAWRRLDVVVHNVGPFLEKPTDATSIADWHAMLDGNLNSAFYVSNAALPHLRLTGGRLVTLGSLNAELARGADNHAAYNTAKTGLVVLTRSLARSEGPRGVRVNMVSPGLTADDGVDPVAAPDAAKIPLRRLGSGADIAEAVAWLVSPKASYVTGAVLTVSGGLWV
jgi:3-oxoacyl-[acyl-carrier protein] reductase